MARRRESKSTSTLIVQLVGLIGLGIAFSPLLRGALLLTAVGALAFLTLIVTILIVRRAAGSPVVESNRTMGTTSPRFVAASPFTSVPSPRHVEPVATNPPRSKVSAIERVRSLHWFQFERFMAGLFSESGFSVQRFGGANPDGGIDLIVQLDGKTYGVQCKHWKAWKIGVKEVREFVGALKDRGIERGIFVTLQKYTPDAKALANGHQIELSSEHEITRMLESAKCEQNTRLLAILNDTRKLCPKCESAMTLRTTRKGLNAGKQFWGCSRYPQCSYRMDLKPEPSTPPETDPADPPTRKCVPEPHPYFRYMPKPATSGPWQFR